MAYSPRLPHGGLCVVDVTDAGLRGDGDYLEAETWRISPKRWLKSSEQSALYFYWESEFLDHRRFWVYTNEIGDLVFVERNRDYDPPEKSGFRLYPADAGKSREYNFSDVAGAIVIILPPGVTVAHADPPVQATIKGDRLVLLARAFFGELVVTLRLEGKASVPAIIKAAGTLNRAYRKRIATRLITAGSRVRPHDRDRSLQAALLGTVIAGIGLIVAAGALAQGWIRMLGIIFGIAAAIASAVWLAWTQFRRHEGEPDAARKDVIGAP